MENKKDCGIGIVSEYETLVQENEKLQAAYDRLLTDYSKLVSKSDKKLVEYEEIVKSYSSETERLRNQIRTMTEAYATLTNENISLIYEKADLQDQLDNLKRDVKEELRFADHRYASLLEKYHNKEAQLEKLEEEMEKMKAEANTAIILDLKRQLNDLTYMQSIASGESMVVGFDISRGKDFTVHSNYYPSCCRNLSDKE